MAALTLTLGAHLLDLDRVPLSISALTLSHAFVPPEALVALVARHLAIQALTPAVAHGTLCSPRDTSPCCCAQCPHAMATQSLC